MHVNWHRGETRAFARKHRNSGRRWYRDPYWLQSTVKRREVRHSATIDSFYDDTPHKRKIGLKPFRGVGGGEWEFYHRFETERARDEAAARHLFRQKWSWWKQYQKIREQSKRQTSGV